MALSSRERPAVWCDFAGVLTVPVTETFVTFCTKVGVAPECLMEAMRAVAREFGTDDIMEPLDTPLVDGVTWVRRVESVLQREFGAVVDLSNFAELWFSGRPPNTVLMEYIQILRSDGVFVGMVSNMPPDFDPYWRAIVGEDLFDAVVLSHTAGVRKPDREIYDLCAATALTTSQSCVLIDDLAINCQGALDAGWTAIEFRDTDDVIARIGELVAREVG